MSIPPRAIRIDGETAEMEGPMRYAKLLLVIALLGCGAFVGWALDVMGPEATAYAATLSNASDVTVGSHDGFITMRPNGATSTIGLLFYPGMRVAPAAYVHKLAGIAAAARIQIAIGRPPLNLAVFSINQADAMRTALPGVTRWYVGGHSLGGAAACFYASRHAAALEGVVIFGTYCGSDLSHSSLRVLNVGGGQDGLFPPDTIAAHRGELPGGAHLITVAGMNHAQFGNYGVQPGDRPATIEDAGAREALTRAVADFFAGSGKEDLR
jgi:hypothetical protein